MIIVFSNVLNDEYSAVKYSTGDNVIQTGDCIRKTPSAQHASGVGHFMQSLFSFAIS